MAKIGVLVISTGEKYHDFIRPMIISARQFFLNGHDKHFLLWTDSRELHGADYVYPAEDVGMPWATLMRYHLFLQQEEKLKEYDYLFYVDCDMLFVDKVGDEVLSELTAVVHPGYAWHFGLESENMYQRPFEPNPDSEAFIYWPKYYFAGGFQGGETEHIISAMKSCKRSIDRDLDKDYIARWHDESHWNSYLIEHPPTKILNPSYCYPAPYPALPPYKAGMVYEKLWGQDFPPKLLALTKGWTMKPIKDNGMDKILKDFQ